MNAALQHSTVWRWLLLVLLAVSAESSALAITDASLTLSALSIVPDLGTAEVSDLVTCASVSGVFNSLGQSSGNSNPVGCAAFLNMASTDVTTSAAVTDAQGSAHAFASLTEGVDAASSVNIPGGTVLAGVTLNGSIADLVGTLDVTGTEPVNVTFSIVVTGSLHGVSDAFGYLQTDDVTASLTVDGDTVLFDFISLPLLPSIPGIANYPSTTVPISETLIGTLQLDPTQSHFFDLEVNAESQAFNIPEPSSLGLILASLGLLTGHRAGKAMRDAPKHLLVAEFQS